MVATPFRRVGILTIACALVVFTTSVVVAQAAQDDRQDDNKKEGEMVLLKRFHSEWVEIKPGKFRMGSASDASESPAREVSIGYAFQAAKYEVPQNLYETVMGTNPSRWKGPRNSVEMTSYDDAVAFCRRVTDKLRQAKLIDDQHVVRLPTEAEWEYIARAGTTTTYSFGNDPQDLGDYAWFTGNAAGNDPPVGAKKPNPWGLYDVHGYLWEWCLDPGHEDYQGAPDDGRPWIAGGDEKLRVIRGGSWKDRAELLTSSVRAGAFRSSDATAQGGSLQFTGGAPRSLKDDAVGFRCVLVHVDQAYAGEN